MDSVGVGDIIRLFYENGHAHYMVTSVNYDNEIMVRGKDGVEELLPTDKGVLTAFDGRAVQGLQIIRPDATEYPKGSDVSIDLQSGKRIRGTVQANEDGVLELAVRDYKEPLFLDSHALHPLVQRISPYTETEERVNLAESAEEPEVEFEALRAEFMNAAGIHIRPPLLTTTAALPRWILPLQRRYVGVLVGGETSAKSKGITETHFIDEIAAALENRYYNNYYHAVFQALLPFVPNKGREAETVVQAVCLEQPVAAGVAAVYYPVFVPPVAQENGEPFEFEEFLVIPQAATLSKAYLPGTRLYDRCLLHPHLGRLDRLLRRKAETAETVNQLNLPPKATVKPSVYETLLTLEPYLIYPKDATLEMLQLLWPRIETKVRQVKARFAARTAATPSTAPANVFPDKYGLPLALSSETLAQMLRADYGRRLLNMPVRPTPPAKKAAAHSSLEVLPTAVVEQFNQCIPLFSKMGARTAANAVAFVDRFAREAGKGDSAAWLYFREESLPLIPVVVERLLRAYRGKGVTGYLAAVEQLKNSARAVLDDDRYVDRDTGFVFARGVPASQEEGAPVEAEVVTPAYTQTDMAILGVLKTVTRNKLADRYEYIVQHVRGMDRPEDVVVGLCAYAALFSQKGAEEVSAALVESFKGLHRYPGPFWDSVKRFGQPALQAKMEEKIKFLGRDYEFVRLNRQAEVQKGREWGAFLPSRTPLVRHNPVTLEDKVYLFAAQLPRLPPSKERQDKIAFLKEARPARRAVLATLTAPPPPAPKVVPERFEDEEEPVPEYDEAVLQELGLRDKERPKLDAETIWRCDEKGGSPEDYVDYLHAGQKVGLEVLAAFVQNVALVFPSLVSRRVHFAAHENLDVRHDRVVAQHLSTGATTRLEIKLNEYYAPLLTLPTSASAQAYFKKRAERQPMGENELSDNDSETAFVRGYLEREETFRKIAKAAKRALEKADEPLLKRCAGRALAHHLSATPLEYECAFVEACVQMYKADVSFSLACAAFFA